MGTHDPKDIDEEVNSSWKLVSHLENEFCDIPAARELVINVREKIEEFKSKMPVIRSLKLCNCRGSQRPFHVQGDAGHPG
jgi:hypothetical protein